MSERVSSTALEGADLTMTYLPEVCDYRDLYC